MSKYEKFFLTLLVAVPSAYLFDLLTDFHFGVNLGVGFGIGFVTGLVINKLFK